MQRIYLLNIGGGHGHFLRYILDKYCTTTPTIHQGVFNKQGQAHQLIPTSGTFVFDEAENDEKIQYLYKNKDLLLIDIDDEILYYERAFLHRANDSQTDLFSEKAIASTLEENGSNFPQFCKNIGISIKDGYMLGFKNPSQQGSIVRNKNRIELCKKNNNKVFCYSLKNFFTFESFKNSLIDVGNFFGLGFDLTNLEKDYQQFYDKNTILQTHNLPIEYLNGNTDVKLDVLQQAYVDAQKN